MPEVEIKDINNTTVSRIDLPDSVFGIKAKKSVLHDAVINYLANQRQGTHSTKTKGLVRGGGKKPWRQKHTGRSRAGSNRSPIWKGGGIVFGPQPRDYSYSLPKKVRRLALKTALSTKFSDGEITVVDGLSIDKPSTKNMVSILKNLELEGKSTLIILPEKDNNIFLSAKNIPRIKVIRVSDLNTYDVVVYNRLLITKDAISRFFEMPVFMESPIRKSSLSPIPQLEPSDGVKEAEGK